MRPRVPLAVVAAVLTVWVAAGCAAPRSAPSAPPTSTAQHLLTISYFETAVALLDDGIRAGSDDWARAKADARTTLTVDSSLTDVHAALADLVKVAGGPHSSFRDPDEVRVWEEAAMAAGGDGPALPSVEIDTDVGIVTLPPFPLDDPQLVQEYVDAGLAAMEPYADADLCGWVVDVSADTGGNANAMIAAVSPLLSDGLVLRGEALDGSVRELVVDGNAVGAEGKVLAAGSGKPFKVNARSVAVLHSGATASAGEAVVVAFYGEENARSFGARTRGFTTGNEYHELSDGAGLTITTTVLQDRLGTSYGFKLEPGVEGADADFRPDALLTPTEWIHRRC